MVEEAAVLVVRHDQRAALPDVLVLPQGLVHVGDEVVAEAHVLRCVLRVRHGVVGVEEAREDERVVRQRPLVDVDGEGLVVALEVLVLLVDPRDLAHLVLVELVRGPRQALFLDLLVDRDQVEDLLEDVVREPAGGGRVREQAVRFGVARDTAGDVEDLCGSARGDAESDRASHSAVGGARGVSAHASG